MAKLSPQNRTAGWLALVALVMVSLSFAAVPFYDWFCRTTGFAGTTSVSQKAPDQPLDQMITVRFDASKERDMPWVFKAVQPSMKLRIGETGLACHGLVGRVGRLVKRQSRFSDSQFHARLGGLENPQHIALF